MVCAISDNCKSSQLLLLKPRAAPRCPWPCTATVILVLAKSDSASERCSGLKIKEVFEEFGKHSKAGPAETRWCQHFNSLETGPTEEASSVNHT